MELYVYLPSFYCQKTLVACFEKNVEVTLRHVDLFDPTAYAAFCLLTPWGRAPLLINDDGERIPESSTIIEFLELHFSRGTTLIPSQPHAAWRVRYYDRLLDAYLGGPLGRLYHDQFKLDGERNPKGVRDAHQQIAETYVWLDAHLSDRHWMAGDTFSMADCTAGSFLHTAREYHPFSAHTNIERYFGEMLTRPSLQRVVAETAAYLAQGPTGRDRHASQD